MPTTIETRAISARYLAYCTWCLGVVPFGQVRRRLVCRRCGRVYRRVDPGAAGRRAALRFMLYGALAGALPVSSLLAMAALGDGHPILSPARLALAAGAGLLSIGCLVRAARLAAGASGFESLTAVEARDLERSLCPGMIRSDVVDALSRRGWRIGKIRTVLGALEPDRAKTA